MAALEGDKDFSPYDPRGKLFRYNCSPWTRLIIDPFPWLRVREQRREYLGRSTVFELAVHGVACVYACDLDDSIFDDLIKTCNEQHPSTEVFPTRSQLTLDYRISIRYDQPENTLMLIDDILNLWGRLDIWVAESGML
jgi:hypothetical protein